MFKQIFRFSLVLIVAIGIGVGIYYLIQSSGLNSPEQFQQEGFNPGQRPPNGDFQERDRGGASIFGVVAILGKLVLISAIAFAVVKIQNYYKPHPVVVKRQ